MQPERAERIAEIVERGLEVEVGHRGPLLVELCGDDRELFVEVASLLHFQEKARDFIETPAVETAAELFADERTGLRPGDALNGYRIISLIGEGGMGEVYLAEDTKLERKVAIKLLKLGLGTANIIRHFHQEERILAGLTHPNIAQLYGGDVTKNGLPYFVMEYVDGARLDDYCRDKQLSIAERLGLFRKICAAVSYAHQHLVIHRDIKPANIRVTADAEPKLLDFGIAKLVDPTTAAIAEQTMTLAAVMTPDYASPEQVRGESITTASDVYSLGVLLYELLTEQKPYKIDSRTPTNVSHAIAEQQPTRPSIAVAKQSRTDGEVKILPKSLRGDLDNIVLMAMRKEPARRYPSVAQFSEDIRRHLEARPVIARKDTLGYRTTKFVSRNKIAVGAAALLLLSLISGLIATGWEARRANRRFNEVRRLANSLMFEIHDSVKDLQGSTPTRRLIVTRALEYLDSLAREAGNDSSLQRELATAYEKVGDIQGNPYYANLGDTDGALASYRKATSIRERLRNISSTIESEMELGRSYRGLGDISEQKGDIGQSVGNYRRSLSIFEQLAAKYPAEFSVQDESARAYETLGDGLSRSGKSETERLACYQKALSIRQSLLTQQPTNPKMRRSVALTYLKIGSASDAKEPHHIGNMRRGVEMMEALSVEDPNSERARREVGFAYYQIGGAQIAAGDYAQALQSRRKAFAIRQEIAEEDPKNVQARFDLAVAHGDLAEALSATGQAADALAHARQSLSILQGMSAGDPTNVVYQRNLGLCYEKLGEAYVALANNEKRSVGQRISDWNEARSWYRKGAELFSALRDRGTLMPADSEEPKKFSAKVGGCDNAIARLKP
jgi:non-specific serine/threonine protein kinase/serine/threonine-protein kinase